MPISSDPSTSAAAAAACSARRRAKRRAGSSGWRRDSYTSAALAGQVDDMTAGALVVLQRQQAAALGVFQQLAERVIAVVALAKAGLPALDRLLDHRAPHALLLAAVALQRLHRLDHQLERFLLAL